LIRDFRKTFDEIPVETDLCIIGGGAAGLALAREFNGSRVRVAVLESGGLKKDPEVQSLYTGSIAGEPYYSELDECRSRFFGGSTNCWGGICTPFLPIDFEQRSWVPDSGWPFTYSELLPYFKRAHLLCSIGPYGYDKRVWNEIGGEALPFDEDKIISHFWQINNRLSERSVHFGKKYYDELNSSPNIQVFLNTNVSELVLNDSRRAIESVTVKTLDGKTSKVIARAVVLCCGGIENARLLLASDRQCSNGVGNSHDLVGRYFQDHLQVPCASVKVSSGQSTLRSYSHLWSYDGTFCLPGMTLSPEAQRQYNSLNISLSIDPVYKADDVWPMVKRVKSDITANRITKGTIIHSFRALRNLSTLGPAVFKRFVYGIRPLGDPHHYTLYARAEQAPNFNSRIRLDSERDRLGMRKTVMEWRTNELDHRSFRVMTNLAKEEFARLNLGQVEAYPWVQEADWPHNMEGGPHHMGTTRMSTNPSKGVVDSNSQVHDIAGLFVAGGSVFPTGGHANCTLTLLATTLRLADHLKVSLDSVVPELASSTKDQ
jgi:choline dehydrogenase-like flavoprotein